MSAVPPPLGLLAELTHRCPLQCPYCSNPRELAKPATELSTAAWCDVIDQATALGVLQLHLSGGEPMARADIFEIVAHAARAGLYTNLITSAVTLDEAKTHRLKAAGLDHVQISVQGVNPGRADRVAGMLGAADKKRAAMRHVKAAGLALTVNAVIHRQNLDEVPALLQLALDEGAERLELAHVQYYGWGLANRAALLPTRAQTMETTALVEAERARLKGRLVIDYVVPDAYAERPKACMGGWGRQVMVVSPDGRAMPCHAADSLLHLDFANVQDRPLAEIWTHDPAFNAYRGTAWMPEPCRTCDRREIDWGGCRCQALALAGDAGVTDPACALSPYRGVMGTIAAEADAPAPPFVYRRFGG
jgi:pyrroloquinoline quinone biosynthesis protein E